MSLFPKNTLFLRNLFGFMQKKSYLCKGIPTIYPKRRAMAKKKILFINQEVSPYMADNDLSLMGHELSRAMQDLGHEIRTFMPKWGTINERRGQLHEVQRLSGMNLIINDTDHPLIIKVASIVSSHVAVYFIDNDDYFSKRRQIIDDDGERSIFFARGVLETIKKMRWTPDIIHCQGWMSASVPFYVKTAYADEPSFAEAKVVTSLFNELQPVELGEKFAQDIAFRDAKPELLSAYDHRFTFEELGKLAIDYSDGVIQAHKDVSETLMKYAADKNVPLLPYIEDFADAYEEFYEKI